MPRAFSFSCKRCGNCCTRADGRVRITEDDVPRIAAALGLSVAGFRSRFLNPGPDGSWLVRLLPGGSCPWFSREGGLGACRIYDARPEHCKTFPHWPEILEDDAAFAEVRRFCAGIEV
ncbi:MAG: YkgJ family cysteine cluster protein [Planctomycetes bacterium]|nr:YkgJ family cysteine cluster protein [Planctomycetota bacterium]MCB9890353.1 YkgJ family cysteine cluster protein [Planctomycetota bacterium]MCB9918171.1 YkgJ family cysteine cluster protein [Planctomycetota bacterium]